VSVEKPGLKIRRKPEEGEAPEAPHDAAAPAATMALGAVAPEPPPAPAPEPPPAPAPEPPPASYSASPTEARPGTHGGVWRDPYAVRPAAPATMAQALGDAPATAEADPTTDDFAAMFGATQTRLQRYSVGDKVQARVESVTHGTVFVSLDAKMEGSIDASELVDDEGRPKVRVGDRIEAFVVSTQGGVKLSTVLSKNARSIELLVEAQAQGIPVEGKVTGVNKGGYDVQVGGSRGFCPLSQLDFDSSVPPEARIGETHRFLITRIDEGGRNVVLSRTQLIREERRRAADETLSRLEVGADVEGAVTRITDFGAFVDLGGIEGMVHVSELGWGRYANPREVLKEGDRVRARVLRIEDADKGGKRIALSMKALQGDPWLDGVRQFQIGQNYTGTVARLEKFGAFIELAPGLDGLAHISELSPGRRINHPQDVVAVGDTVQVQVLDIDPRKRQIALSMKALMDDPWSEAVSRFGVGTKVQGTVDSVQSFGIFVQLEGGLMGLLPLSHLADGEDKAVHAKFMSGAPVEATVIAVEPERRRLTLSRRASAEFEGQANYKAYAATKAAPEKLGSFADLFNKARRP
jgi:small subunit ribosomal protein S1